MNTSQSSAPLISNKLTTNTTINPTLYIQKIKEFLLRGYTINKSGEYIEPPKLTINQMLYDQQIVPVGSYAVPDVLLKDLRDLLLKNANQSNPLGSSQINLPIIYDEDDFLSSSDDKPSDGIIDKNLSDNSFNDDYDEDEDDDRDRDDGIVGDKIHESHQQLDKLPSNNCDSNNSTDK